jgi:transcriptional regulator with XRE-family HTH domain
MKIGVEVRRRRQALGLTLDDLAERSGLSPHYLSTLEDGHRDPRLSTIQAVAKALRVPAAELVGEGAGAPDLPGIGPLFERVPVEAREAILTLLRLLVTAPDRPHKARAQARAGGDGRRTTEPTVRKRRGR